MDRIRKFFRKRRILFSGLALLILALLSAAFPVERQREFGSSDIRQGAEFRYTVKIPEPGFPWQVAADTRDDPYGSTLKLSEDEKSLKPGHASTSAIATLGHGRYAHWDDTLHFSTSDNSDPRSNGRTYLVHYHVVLRPWLLDPLKWLGLALIAAYLAAHAGSLFGRDRPLGRALVAAKPYLIQTAVTLALVFLLVEVWARVFPPSDKVVWPSIHDPVLGSRFESNATVHSTNGLDFEVTETSNEVGFLDRPLPPTDKADGHCRIAIIGDSFVEAAQVPIKEKVQVVLETMAEHAFPGLNVETMAFGFSGTGQINQLPYYDHLAKPRRPDVVVLVFVGNDFANNSSLLEAIRVGWDPKRTPRVFAREDKHGAITIQPIAADWKAHRLPKAKDHQGWLHKRLYKASRFYRWLFAKLSLQFPALARGMGNEIHGRDKMAFNLRYLTLSDPEYDAMFRGWSYPKGPSLDQMFRETDPLPLAFAQALRFTRFGLAEFKRRSIEDGLELVVLGTHGLTGLPEARLKTMLEDLKIPYLSQRAYIKSLGEPVNKAHWRHDGHWSKQGHIWASEQLLGYFSQRGLCGRRGIVAGTDPTAIN